MLLLSLCYSYIMIIVNQSLTLTILLHASVSLQDKEQRMLLSQQHGKVLKSYYRDYTGCVREGDLW